MYMTNKASNICSLIEEHDLEMQERLNNKTIALESAKEGIRKVLSMYGTIEGRNILTRIIDEGDPL